MTHFPNTPVPDNDSEKQSPGSAIDFPQVDLATVKDWTTEEERRVVRKLDFVVLGLLCYGFFCFTLEKANIANAASTTFLTDIGINKNQYNTGQGLLYLGIIICEVPSQALIQRLGTQKWLTIQVFAFGIVATLQVFLKNYAGYLVTRLLIGLTECGYIPASLYTISNFYKRSELASRSGLFYMGAMLGTALGGFIAAAILTIDGALLSWQYLFVIEGSMALFGSLLFLLFMPDSPHRPRPVIFSSLTIFTARDCEIILQRVLLDDEQKGDGRRAVSMKEIWVTLGNWRNYPHVIQAICLAGPTAALLQYSPILIKTFGFDTVRANALSSVGGWANLLATVTLGLTSDWTGWRGPLVITTSLLYLTFYAAFRSVLPGSDTASKYGLMVCTLAFSQCWHPVNVTWMSLNQPSPQARSIAMAMITMGSNIGGLIGTQILRASDAPYYPIGFEVAICLITVGSAVIILQHLQYRISNKRNSSLFASVDGIDANAPVKYVL